MKAGGQEDCAPQTDGLKAVNKRSGHSGRPCHIRHLCDARAAWSDLRVFQVLSGVGMRYPVNDHAVPVVEWEEPSQAYAFRFPETGRKVMTKGRTPELLLALVIAAEERLQ